MKGLCSYALFIVNGCTSGAETVSQIFGGSSYRIRRLPTATTECLMHRCVYCYNYSIVTVHVEESERILKDFLINACLEDNDCVSRISQYPTLSKSNWEVQRSHFPTTDKLTCSDDSESKKEELCFRVYTRMTFLSCAKDQSETALNKHHIVYLSRTSVTALSSLSFSGQLAAKILESVQRRSGGSYRR